MPLTSFQKEVLRVIAANRNPESHLAGGAVINRADDSPRFSKDMDIFHEADRQVVASAEADARSLSANGFEVEWEQIAPGIRKGKVRRGADLVELDWVVDSAFRFFPVQPDLDFGYCLHSADLATNKMLALAGRSVIRDYIDILHLDEIYLSLGTLCWAACAKDPGFNPVSLLEMAKRHTRYTHDELAQERLTRPLTLPALKQHWLAAVDRAEALFPRLRAEDIGCLYLAPDGTPVTPEPDDPAFPSLRRHHASLRGAWPVIATP
ncbi:MAG: nucleotidyl transferase AbiEii/AbiGii toxin family protein [Gemmataceae bacterium]